MSTVYLLWDTWNEELLGVYGTEDKANDVLDGRKKESGEAGWLIEERTVE